MHFAVVLAKALALGEVEEGAVVAFLVTLAGNFQSCRSDEQSRPLLSNLAKLPVIRLSVRLPLPACVCKVIGREVEETEVEWCGDHGFRPNDEGGFKLSGEGVVGGFEVSGEDFFVAGAGGFDVLGDGVLDDGDGVAGRDGFLALVEAVVTVDEAGQEGQGGEHEKFCGGELGGTGVFALDDGAQKQVAKEAVDHGDQEGQAVGAGDIGDLDEHGVVVLGVGQEEPGKACEEGGAE